MFEKQKIKKDDCSGRPETLGPCAPQIVKNKTDLVLICQNIDAMRILKCHSQESSIEIRAQKELGLHPIYIHVRILE